jgi:hypothetical protein
MVALATLISLSHPLSASNQRGFPGAPYICNLAKVSKMGIAKHITVRSGPTDTSPRIDQLNPGAFVYICDENSGWFKVFYGDAANRCGPESPKAGLDVRKTQTCKSGWVREKWIEVLSG